jgi:hypothetical protein
VALRSETKSGLLRLCDLEKSWAAYRKENGLDLYGAQRQSFHLTPVPSCGGCSMIARGAWSGYGQGAASRSGDSLAVSRRADPLTSPAGEPAPQKVLAALLGLPNILPVTCSSQILPLAGTAKAAPRVLVADKGLPGHYPGVRR